MERLYANPLIPQIKKKVILKVDILSAVETVPVSVCAERMCILGATRILGLVLVIIYVLCGSTPIM